MKSRILPSIALFLLVSATGTAQGFLPVGGATGNSHYALETTVSGFTSNPTAVLSHGSLPAASLHTSGVESVADGQTQARVTVTSDFQSLTVEGIAEGSRCQIFGIDGRQLMEGVLRDGHVSVASIPAGHYLLRILPQGEPACITHFLKRQ
jgi:hypothetical protein